VEELYFRGYLLPRLSRFGRKAPYLKRFCSLSNDLWQRWLWPTVLVSSRHWSSLCLKNRDLGRAPADTADPE
jgi:hypothetical protein